MKEETCCFTGHRLRPQDRLPGIAQRLSRQVDEMIARGVTIFVSGGALGFDQLAAVTVLNKRDLNGGIRLIIAQPCRTQSARWTEKQKKVYDSILARADEVICLSDEYFTGCMQLRNRWMVDHSGYLIACMARLQGGTAQTVNYALKKGLDITNVWE